jgi:5-methylcytosine-specific restriction endonuclease McrA
MGKQRNNETKVQYNARMNAYMKARYFIRREAAIKRLGGKCIDCGSMTMLEFDHKHRADKEHNVGKLFSSANLEKLNKEVDKCVLRCVGCHAYRTAFDKLSGSDILGEIA